MNISYALHEAAMVDLAPEKDSDSFVTARTQKPRTDTTEVALSPADSDNIFPQLSEASE